MLVSLGIFIIAFTMGGLNYVTTVLQARCKGMTMMRMPLSVWGIFMATILGLLAFPALLVSAVMMTLDGTLGTSFFMPAVSSMGQSLDHNGGSPLLFQHLFWFFGHPEVYIVALPAFGIVSDLLSTHARKNIFGYRMMVWAILAIGGLSFVVWAHHMYVSGMNPYFGFFFATTTLIIAVPTAIKVYNWVLTLWKGDIHLTVPMLFAIGFIFTFIHGGPDGPVPRQRDRGPAPFGHLLRGRALPHGDGRVADPRGIRRDLPLVPEDHGPHVERDARQDPLLDDLPRDLRHLPPDALPRHLGVPRRYYALGDTEFLPQSVHTINEAITIAALIVAASVLVFLFNMITSLWRGEKRRRIRGSRRRSSGRRPTRRRITETGARACRSSIAGPMTTAFPARRMTSSRRTCRWTRSSAAGRDHGVHH
jgi:cytochrome c oxidase subunit 1